MLNLRTCKKINRSIISISLSLQTTQNIMMWAGVESSLWVLIWHQIDTQSLWNLRIMASVENAKRYDKQFLNFWSNELRHGAAFQTDYAKLKLVCRIVYKIWKKSKPTDEINKFKCQQLTPRIMCIILFCV